jgi:rare lipoprotein A
MRRTSFGTARTRVMLPIFGFAFGLVIVMMILTHTVSAKDGQAPAVTQLTTPQSAPQGAAKPLSKKSAKTKRWYEVGIASWYGSQFQGRKTAAGERFDMNTMTCAHPSLPMGTWLRVTNLRNRRIAFVRVNDRGPVIDGRIVDLSYAAAQAVGLAGVGKVKLESVREGDPDLDRALIAQLQFPVLPDPLVP